MKMTTNNPDWVKDSKIDVMDDLRAGRVTPEQLSSFGLWCLGKAMGHAISEGLESMGGDDSTD